jgi:predicted dinucleotide-binding enzyme
VNHLPRSFGLHVNQSGGSHDGTDAHSIVGSGNIGSALARLFARAGVEVGKRVIFIATDVPAAGDRIAELVGDLGLAAVQLGRIDEGGLLVQAPNALVPRDLVERPR